jgi:glycosyltransferase involved in cell wall biosynthesis
MAAFTTPSNQASSMRKSVPLVTIAIPTYNRAATYLPQSLESALRQTYANIEVIVSDNCSTDDTAALVNHLAHPRLKYFRQEQNIGFIDNFNFCLREAKGVYFLLLHDDDMIDSDFVESCMRAAEYSSGFGMIRTGIRVVDSQGGMLWESPNKAGGLVAEEFFRAWFAGKTACYLPNTLFNTDKLKGLDGFRSKYGLTPDGIAMVRLASKFPRADVEQVKASFRKHGAELTFSAKVGEWCEEYLILLDLMCSSASNKKALIRDEGMKFFARLNYGRAKAVQAPTQRFAAYLTVLRHYHRFPPVDLLCGTPVYRGAMFCRTSAYRALRFARRQLIKKVFSGT